LLLAAACLLAISPAIGSAQMRPGKQGSSNVKVVAHVPLGADNTTGDIEIEQELSRPYAYVPRLGGIHNKARSGGGGYSIVSLKDPTHARVIYDWRIENGELHQGYGGLQGKYFKLRGHYYYALGMMFNGSGPDTDLGAVVFDVNGLPDSSTVKELGRIKEARAPGGFHNVFAYKHSDGRTLLFVTIGGATNPRVGVTLSSVANVYDMEKFLAHDPNQGFIGQVPVPDGGGCANCVPPVAGPGWYHDLVVVYDAATKQDRFYGAAWGSGYYVFDVSKIESPKLLASITGFAGMTDNHSLRPTPDGRYLVTQQEFGNQDMFGGASSPMRVWDLKPALDGQVKAISRPIGAWMVDTKPDGWKDMLHNNEMRWPYVFTSNYLDGLDVVNLMDPTNPYTVGYYDTFDYPGAHGEGGAFGINVRNADGLIVLSDENTGFWAFHMEGFNGWNGHDWGMPNNSSAQDWDNGPDGAPKSNRVS